jgi:O-methyltransferase
MSTPSNKRHEIRSAIQSSRAPAVVRSVVDRRLTYLTWPRLFSLQRACAEIAEVPGDVVECGVGLGGSGVVLATLTRRPYHGYDVFGMVPPPGASDAFDAQTRYQQIAGGKGRGPGGEPYWGYRRDLLGTVTQTFASFGLDTISLHQGHFADTLHLTAPVALAHVDCARRWLDRHRGRLLRVSGRARGHRRVPGSAPGVPGRALARAPRAPTRGRRPGRVIPIGEGYTSARWT